MKLKVRALATSIFSFALLFAESSPLLASTVTGSANSQTDSLDSREGMVLRVKLLSALNTQTNKADDGVTAEIISPSSYQGGFVEGLVKESKSGNSIHGSATLTVTFHTLTIGQQTIGISSEVESIRNSKGAPNVDEEGKAIEKKSNLTTVAKAAAVGAVVGNVLGGRQGAGIGAAVGSGLSLLFVKLTVKGANIILEPGSELGLRVHRCEKCQPLPTAQTRGLNPSFGNTQSASSPAVPSEFRIYNSLYGYKLSVPSGWREFTDKNGATFAPEGRYSIYQGQNHYTLGTIVGVTQANGRNLQEATDGYVKGIAQSNSYLKLLPTSQSLTVDGRNIIRKTLTGQSPVAGHVEVVTIHTLYLREGTLLYVINIASQNEQQTHGAVFEKIVNSLSVSR